MFFLVMFFFGYMKRWHSLLSSNVVALLLYDMVQCQLFKNLFYFNKLKLYEAWWDALSLLDCSCFLLICSG